MFPDSIIQDILVGISGVISIYVVLLIIVSAIIYVIIYAINQRDKANERMRKLRERNKAAGYND